MRDPASGRPLRVALTGGIATGKSYVRARFEALGAPTIDSDTLARAAVAFGTPGYAAVIREFGPAVMDSSGAIDRGKLGAIVFPDAERRRVLEGIIHPFVLEATVRWYQALPHGTPFAVADVPLLYEIGRHVDFDAVVVAACSPDLQVKRVIARDGLSEAAARQRLAAQLPIAEKAARADYVIHTDGSFEETDRQVKDLFDALSRRSSRSA